MSDSMLQVFEGSEIRIVERSDGEFWWVASDVCRAIEIKNVSDSLDRLEDDEKGIATSDTLGGEQDMLCVSEPGLYSLIFTSRKAAAKRFKRWVLHEVLPSIRKTGRYESPRTEPAPLPFRQVAVETTDAIAHVQDILGASNPRLAQILIDYAMQDLKLPALPGTADRLSGCVEIANDLGYRVGKELGQLGKYVASAWRSKFGTDPQRDKRECGGAMRNIAVYPSNEPIVIAAIKEFYQGDA